MYSASRHLRIATRAAVVLVGAAALSVGISACGSDSQDTAATTPASQVPVREAGEPADETYTHATTINLSSDPELRLYSSELDGGVWATDPPTSVGGQGPDRNKQFTAGSDGFMTGDEGTVVFKPVDPNVGGQVAISFDNPFSGDPSSSCTATGQLKCEVESETVTEDETFGRKQALDLYVTQP